MTFGKLVCSLGCSSSSPSFGVEFGSASPGGSLGVVVAVIVGGGVSKVPFMDVGSGRGGFVGGVQGLSQFNCVR